MPDKLLLIRRTLPLLVLSLLGTRLAQKLSSTGALTKIFAGVIFAVAAYMLWQSWMAM